MVNIGLARGWTKQLIEIATFFYLTLIMTVGGKYDLALLKFV